MTGRDDDKPGIGDSTEVVTYEEALKRRPASAPAKLGRYKLEKVIAQGGMAEIWLATVEGPARFQKKVVLKRIRPSLVKQASDQSHDKGGQAGRNVEMFVREAKLLASLEHKHIVQVIELGVEPPSGPGKQPEHYIAMEHLEGLTLRDLALRVWQAKRPLPLEVALRIVADACLGLEHAHKLTDERGQPANLVHRDISPDNLFVTTSGLTKLLDFGIAKREDWSNLTMAGELKGKVPYMAPEQLKGDRVDARTDLFAVGVVLYWLLTGRRPFDGPSDVFTMKAILDDAPRPLRALNPQVPPMLEDVVLSCLEKDPEKRISSAAALHDALSMLLMGVTGNAPGAADVVAAALSLPPSTYEVVPDVAAVPVQRWGGPNPLGPGSTSSMASPTITASRSASPIPQARDVSSQKTQQMALDGKVAMVIGAGGKVTAVPSSSSASSVASVPSSAPVGSKTVLGGGGDTSETFYEIPATDVPSVPPPPLPPSSPSVGFLPTDPVATLPPPPPQLAGQLAEAATVQRAAPQMPDAPTVQRRRSWKDDVPAELRDTVDLGLDAHGNPVAQKPLLPMPSPPTVPTFTQPGPLGEPSPSGARNVVAMFAGVVVALFVLGVVAVAVGAVDNPFAKVPAVVDAGSVAVVVPVVVPVVVDAGVVVAVVPVIVDAGAPAIVDAGVVEAAVVDAGVVDEDLPDGKEDDDKTPSKKKKRAHPKQPTAAVGEGNLLIRVRPWAKVSIDSLPVGTTPFPVLALPAGKHRVRLEHENIEKVQTVDIKAGQTTTLQIDMRAP